MTLVPRSLYARMVLVVIGGLIAAQVLSTLILFDERARWVLQSRINRSSHRVADSVRVLDAVPPESRAAVAAGFASAGYELRLSDALPVLPPSDLDLAEVAASFTAELQGRLGAQAEPTVSLRFAPGDSSSTRVWLNPFTTPVPATALDVALPSRDGRQWYWLRTELPADTRGIPERVLWDMALRLALLVALLLLAVSWVVRPLSLLGRAAERLGRNLDEPPVPERGPTEVRRAAAAFNQMQTRVRELVREKSRMLAAVSHDLKTPITRLRLRAEMLGDGELRTKIGRDLDEMESMVAGTLDLMRGSDAVEPLVRTDLAALLESVQADYEDTGQPVMLEEVRVATLELRPQALRRCLANLIDNGLKYGQRVRLRARAETAQVRVEIDDDGPGIPEADLERVFEPFYRVEASRNRETGGSGLGLCIARAIALEHAGTLVLSNRDGGGLRATLTLPAH